MTKPAHCISPLPHRTQRGDALMEALIALLLTAILGLGLSYAASPCPATPPARMPSAA